MKDGGWKNRNVAQAQRKLTERQLLTPEDVPPFAAFLRAMAFWTQRCVVHNLLDIGCGVGHYRMLLQHYYPTILYKGVDYSEAMIQEALHWQPQGNFQIKTFEDVRVAGFDLVLVAQVLEYQHPDPWEGLRRLLDQPRDGALLFHRLRLTPDPSHWLRDEPTYCGNTADNWLWNLSELEAYLRAANGTVIYSDSWNLNATLIVTP